MRPIGLWARYSTRQTNQAAKGHKIYLCLLRDLCAEQVDQM